MRFRFGNGQERLIVRADLPAPEKISWTPFNRKLLAEAVARELLSEEELAEKYKVSSVQLKSDAPIRPIKNKTSVKIKPRRGKRGVVPKPAWVLDAGYTQVEIPEKGELLVGDVYFDLDCDEVTLGGQPVRLRGRELVVLSVLMFHAGQLLTQSQLLFALAEYGFFPGVEGFRFFLVELRARLGERREYLQTVPRKGYTFRNPSAKSAVR